MCRSISIILKFENKAGEGADNKGEEGRGLHKIEGLRNPVTLCQLCCSYYDQFPNKFLPQWLNVSNMKLMKWNWHEISYLHVILFLYSREIIGGYTFLSIWNWLIHSVYWRIDPSPLFLAKRPFKLKNCPSPFFLGNPPLYIHF